MQTDMHFYGTYAIARAAGIKPKIAEQIATAAQYVDDSDTADFELSDGTYLYCPATGHHPVDKQNIYGLDQRRVWIPFHFLPGAEGQTNAERLICTKDSAVAQAMLAYVLTQSAEPFGVMLVGIAAHVYADTFAHYGFSGVSSITNQVDIGTIDISSVNDDKIKEYISRKAEQFFGRFGVEIANKVALGHGGVATYPDRPFLIWNFNYGDGRSSGIRRNPDTFLDACEKLHAFFIRVAESNPEFADNLPPTPFEIIKPTIISVLATEAELELRVAAWQSAMKSGLMTGQSESIPWYDVNRFGFELRACSGLSADDVSQFGAFQFLTAATAYRHFVLDELLPEYDVPVFLLK